MIQKNKVNEFNIENVKVLIIFKSNVLYFEEEEKTLKTTWSDEDFDDSQDDDDDHVSNYVGFEVTSKMDVSGTIKNNVATMTTRSSKSDDVITCSGLVSNFSEYSELDDSDGDEPNTKDIQKAYDVMYNNLLKVCKLNRSLKKKIVELTNKKEVIKRSTINYEFFAIEKEIKV